MRHPPHQLYSILEIRTQLKQNTKSKKNQLHPPIMADNVNTYGNLFGELTNQILEENFQVKFTNDSTAKINCNNSENYRKAINMPQNNNFNFHAYENKQSRQIRVMEKNLHHLCNQETL